jgi:uncharacterized protein
MQDSSPAKRLESLPTTDVGGLLVPVAVGFPARLLGLSYLDREEAGAGLLIQRCSSVHTFGMRFALDVHFLDGRLRRLAIRRSVPPRRIAGHRGAVAVLELPAVAESGNIGDDGGDSGGVSPE